MESNDEQATSDGPDGSTVTPERDVVQWIGIIVIVVGTGLIVLQSFGIATLDAGTFRYYLAAGVVLTGGVEVVRAVASGP